MKVICVTEEDFEPNVLGLPKSQLIKVGDILTVERRTYSNDKGTEYIPCYKFYEISYWVFDRRNFSPLSEIDELELVNIKEMVV